MIDVYRVAEAIEGALDGVLDDGDDGPLKTGALVAGGSSTEAMLDVTATDLGTGETETFIVLVRSAKEDEE